MTPSDTIPWVDPQRLQLFTSWLNRISGPFELNPASLRHASADASFRRYFRIDTQIDGDELGQPTSFIIMDAPPDKEDSKPFVKVRQLMQGAGLFVPQLHDWDPIHGFMLLSDLGAQTMLQGMSTSVPDLALYEQATDALIQWQLSSKPLVLPDYDNALLMRELQLFPDWFIKVHLQKTLTASDTDMLQTTFDRIVANNLASSCVYVHRDFMPRNLMLPHSHDTLHLGQLGVLDFQDAVYGPITYDIASLMRDAFLSWDEPFVLDVTVRYWQKARLAGLPVHADFGEFYRAVEWMGLQRHLKILGIFARLTLRDGKPKYLADTPRFLHYVRHTCNRYNELRPFGRWLDQLTGHVQPEGIAFGRM